MGRYNRRNSGGFGILGFILTIMIISSVGDIFSFGIGLIFDILRIVGSVTVPMIFVFFMIKLISDAIKKKNGTATSSTTSNNSNQKDLLKKMNKYFENNSQLNIDDETYLVLTDKDNISLDTVDIYMRSEYIGTLKDYYNAYPYAYNSLANELNRYLNRKNKKKAETTTVAKEENAEPKKEKTADKNDCASYIQKFTLQQKEINNEQINNGLSETIEYLRQIKKIEDEFSESKNKTGKLYQYYLPMLNDILANYIRLKKNAGNSADSKESEDRLLKTIVLINGALKTISSSLVEDYYTEMNVDMRTLESILKKDGLVDEMNKEKSNEQ